MPTQTDYFNNSGANNWYAPHGASSVVVEAIGGGGAGANRNSNGSGGGGAGGAYAKNNGFPAVPGTLYPLTVGAGGNTNNNSHGVDTSFNTSTVVAKGGNTADRNNATGQSAYASSSSTGDVKFAGGNGATGAVPNANNGGGGGSSGGNNGAGVDGSGNNGGISGLPGGAGAGGNGAKTGSAVGVSGTFPGGAGGGATRNSATNRSGGNGANGQVIVTYNYIPNAILLDGTTQYGTVDTFAGIDAMTDGQGTIEGWFFNDPASVNYAVACAFDRSDDYSVTNLQTENSVGSDGVNFKYDYGAGTDADGFNSNGVFTTLRWVHVAQVFTPGGKTKIYVNGTELASYSLQTTPSGTPTAWDGCPFNVGRSARPGPGSDPYWKGKIGGFVRVWSTIRTQTEINNNKALQLEAANVTGLVINLRFEEGQGTFVLNEASPANSMSLTGSPSWAPGPPITPSRAPGKLVKSLQAVNRAGTY